VGGRMPIVDYLVLDDEPHLVVNACVTCGASYFDRRNGCARCGGQEFERRPIATEGEVRAFTIVHRAAPNVGVPYVSAVVELVDGERVKTNLVNVQPSPDDVRVGMPVRLATYVAASDDDGTDAIAFAFEPVGGDDR
jgi:uncharacterized protein